MAAGLKVIKKGDRLIKEYVDTKTGKITLYEPGIKLEVSDFKGTWYPAKVLEVDYEENEVLVHYDKWSSRFDEWIKTDSNRLRPTSDTNVVKIQFKVGERVEALWNNDGQRYPGTIKAIHPNDYYEVLFDDGIKCKKKASQIFKSQRITRRLAAATGKKQGKTGEILDGSNSNLVGNEDGKGSWKASKRRGRNSSTVGEEEEMGISQERSLNNPDSVELSDHATNSLEMSKSPDVSQENNLSTLGHHSIFEPVSTDLGKRKRACHDYSLFLKIPKKSVKSPAPAEFEKKKRASKRLEETEGELESHVESTQDAEDISTEDKDLVQVTPETPEVPLKRMRKSSMKAIENIAADDLVPKRRAGRLRSTMSTSSVHHEDSSVLLTDLATSMSEVESGFVDDKGNVVNIEQTVDGGYICPIEKCGKHFRKDSLLQMHLKHYHPDSNIQFLGNKMNVVEMAIAKARTRTGSNVDVKDKDSGTPLSPEPVVLNKSRRKSSPISHAKVVNLDDGISDDYGDNDLTSDNLIERPTEELIIDTPSAEDESKNTVDNSVEDMASANVCVLLEKINLKKYREKNRAKRFSQRGRLIAPKAWKKISSETESDFSDSSEDEPEEEASANEKSYPATKSHSSTMSTRYKEKHAANGSRNDEQQQLKSFNLSPKISLETSEKRFSRNLRSFHNSSSTLQIQNRSSGSKRGSRTSKKSLMSGFSAKKLDLICDELIKLENKKRMLAKPRFEDVRVDVISCECGLQEEFGLMMQCELCQAWQHGSCYDILEVTQLPRYYVCSFCRDPKNVRATHQHEWYQEVSATGRLPRFSFGEANDVAVEDRLRRSNDLLNCLGSIQALLRSTQMKISMLESSTDHPKLVMWSQDLADPLKASRQEDFRNNFRSVLRHLLKGNKNDKEFVAQLRQCVVDQTSDTLPERLKMETLVMERLHTRAKRAQEEYMSKTKSQDNGVANSTSEEADLACSSVKSYSSTDNLMTNQDLPISTKLEDQLKAFKKDLVQKLRAGSVPVFHSKEYGSKYLLVTKDWNPPSSGKVCKMSQKILFPDGTIANQSVGSGTIVDAAHGINFVQAIEQENGSESSQDKNLVHVPILNQLHLCGSCKKSYNLNWSRKDFARSSQICQGCYICMKKPNDVKSQSENLESSTQPEPSIPGVTENHLSSSNNATGLKSLKILCTEALNKSHENINSTEIQRETSSIKIPKKITSERCRINLQATIIKEQALLDLHLDTIESKLSDLDHEAFSDPQTALAKFKDLEELRKKVQLINDSISFMRNLNPNPTAV